MKTRTQRASREARLNAQMQIIEGMVHRGHLIVSIKHGSEFGAIYLSTDEVLSHARSGQSSFVRLEEAIEDARSRLDYELAATELDLASGGTLL